MFRHSDPMGSIAVGLALLVLLWSLEKGEALVAGYGRPPNCITLECPSFKVLHYQKDLEIRSYHKDVWMSTSPVNSSSYKEAANIGFSSLFAYIQGKNKQGTKIDMTAPVLVDIYPSAGPFCNSSFVMHFFVPRKFQKNPPLSDQVHPEVWPKQQYAAVRRFGGFMEDSNIAAQAAALRNSLKGTPWESAIEKGVHRSPQAYTVAGYNSPFEYENRINEVMLLFDMK